MELIIETPDVKTLAWCDIAIGEVFKTGTGDVYIKLASRCSSQAFNSLQLEIDSYNGKDFSYSDVVTPAKSMTIKF